MTDHALPEPPPAPVRRRPWGLVAVIASVLAVVLIAVAAFGAWRFFFGGGPRPAEVLPASTFALVTVDLDPSGGQKVEGIKTLRKFPTFREESGLTPESDPIKRLFDEIQDQGACKDLDYERDVKSWIGQRVGLGGVVIDDKPAPVVALQVSDRDNARSGFASLAKCAEPDEDDQFGWTLADDYILISDSTAHAKTIAAQGQKAPLSDDEDFQKWTEEAGGAGIMNVYVGREAVDVASKELSSSIEEEKSQDDPTDEDLSLPGSSDERDELADALAAYKDFQGAAAVLRFADGGIELSMAGGAGKSTSGKETVADHVAAMPKDTALLFALAVPPGAFDAIEKADPKGSGSDLLSGMLGIDFPDDLKTLLGKSLSISLGGEAPDDLSSIDGPGDISVGALIRGDTEKIDAVITKLEKSSGSSLEDLEVTKASKDGKIAFASNKDYADQLFGKGSLADDEGFKDAVPNADDAQMITYVDFDGKWGKAVLKMIREDGSDESDEVADNLAVLRAFGASAWTDGDVSHALVRLSLK
jgi:hypothetical protein